jgi:hypothetical protein
MADPCVAAPCIARRIAAAFSARAITVIAISIAVSVRSAARFIAARARGYSALASRLFASFALAVRNVAISVLAILALAARAGAVAVAFFILVAATFFFVAAAWFSLLVRFLGERYSHRQWHDNHRSHQPDRESLRHRQFSVKVKRNRPLGGPLVYEIPAVSPSAAVQLATLNAANQFP